MTYGTPWQPVTFPKGKLEYASEVSEVAQKLLEA